MPNELRRKSDSRQLPAADDRTRQQIDSTDDQPQRTDDHIRSRAYELYEKRGGEQGYDLDDWLQAEDELRSEGGKRL